MTTKITIKNDSAKDSDNHIVLVKQQGCLIGKLYPGEQLLEHHVWTDAPITIEEKPLES